MTSRMTPALDVITVVVLVVSAGVAVANYRGGGHDEPPPPIIDVSSEGQVVEIEGTPLLGIDSADLVLVEFSDFLCPYCRRHANTVFKQIVKEYVDTGRISKTQSTMFMTSPSVLYQHVERETLGSTSRPQQMRGPQ